MKAIGLDIGTTTICGVVLDGENGEVLFSRTLPNDTSIESENGFEKLQDPEKILHQICKLLEEMAQLYPDADSIGITGQMHGILYVDQEGEAVSPLYTWQDESGNQIFRSGVPADKKTYAEVLTERTGYFAATGFGLTTCYYHQVNGLIPESAARLCTIGDYAAMKLTGRRSPVISPSNAASLGLFDLEKGEFDPAAIANAGIAAALLPEVIKGAVQVGRVRAQSPEVQIPGERRSLSVPDACAGIPDAYAGIPVSIALGDNQASVIGTVKDPEKTVLVNVGTGSQISVGSRSYASDSAASQRHAADSAMLRSHAAAPAVELRPLTEDDYIFVGACLCGGRAYAALEKFFRQVADMAGGEAGAGKAGGSTAKLYDRMSALLLNTEIEAENRVRVNPQFCGTRRQPELRGSISGISLENLTPQSMIRGFLYGIAGELYEMYRCIRPQLKTKPVYLVGSGNGIRMNPALQRIFEELFGMKLQIPVHTEEAACGTALFSLVAAGKRETLRQAQEVIRYV